MRNTGESLEALVASIEGYLAGEGFKVETRLRLFDEEGLEAGELDVQVTGPVGSSNIRWVLECRDRPSQGAADLAWIEQLVARRERLNVDKMFAVSTTGFSPAARKLAEETGIVLRTVNGIEDIREEFLVRGAALIHQHVSQIGLIDIRSADGTRKGTQNIQDPKLRPQGQGPWRTITEILDEVTPDLPASGSYPITSSRVFATEAPYELQAGGEIISLTRLRVPYEITAIQYVSRALTGRIYAEGDREVGREGVFDFETPSGKTSLRVQLLPQADGGLTLRVLDESDEGMRLRRMTVLGW